MELESQVAKIQLGPEKHEAASFVYLSAEKLPFGAESFLVAEILEPDSALGNSSGQVVSGMQTALKTAFKKNADEETFENAVALVNAELGKQATLGQTNWVNKINCILGVRTGKVFNIATTGKTTAFLMRDGELTDLNCSSPKPHPLRTFENFASGKLQLNDILILSTPQLFNHISVDKIKTILSQGNFLKSAGQIIEILKANASPEISFGTILVLESKPGELPEEEINLEEYIEAAKPSAPGVLDKAWQFLQALAVPGKKITKPPYNKTQFRDYFGMFFSRLKGLGDNGKTLLRVISKGAEFGKSNLAPSQIKKFSSEKKFFFFSLLVLLFAVIFSTSVAVYKKNKREAETKILAAIENAGKNISDADAALLYNDELSAKEYYLKAEELLSGLKGLSASQEARASEIKKENEAIKSRLEKTSVVKAENLGTLAAGNALISLPEYFAVQAQTHIVSLEKSTNTVRDDALKFEGKIELAETVAKNKAVAYDGAALKIWDYSSGTGGEGLISGVPQKENAVGLKLYPTNQRVYMLDKSKNEILSFAVLQNSLARPQVSVNLKNDEGKSARDLAIDGSIYILTNETVKKYHLGSRAEFKPVFLTPLNNPKKIQTEINFSNIYVLDSGNKRIIILKKDGSILKTLISEDFTDLMDFEVDEKNKVIYVLNGSSLLKIAIP
ncbi:MAG: hypothetical protein AAB410_05015 [Patescibacteria group bacterium]